MTVHSVKTTIEQFALTDQGVKTWNVRERGYQAGDILRFEEWDPGARIYTGRWVERYVETIRECEGDDGHAMLVTAFADESDE